MMKHTHKCMNIKLIEKHINEVHEGQCTPEAISNGNQLIVNIPFLLY